MAREIQHPLLPGSVETIHLLDDLVFDSFGHNEINLGKGLAKVKAGESQVCSERGPHPEVRPRGPLSYLKC